MPPPLPTLTLCLAITWDGRVATRAGIPSSTASRTHARRLEAARSESDALISSPPRPGAPDHPAPLLRAVVSDSGRVSPSLPLFSNPPAPVVVFSTERMPRATRARLAPLATLHLDDTPNVRLRAMLATLGRSHGIRHALCEGGESLARALLEAGLVDDLRLTLCPLLFGGKTAPSLTGPAGAFLKKSAPWRVRQWEIADGECFLRLRPALPARTSTSAHR